MSQAARTANVPSKKPVEAPPEQPTSRVKWLLGWVLSPTLFFGGIFLGGAYLGANHPEGWVTRSVLWVAGVF